ncbi:MAG: ABC transporter permease [Candidatus Limnocylindrales bacterium]
MSGLLQLFNADMVGALLLYTTPILLAAIGCVFTQQANILNIAMEGMMLTAAFFAVAVGAATQSVTLALAGAIASAMVMSAVFGYVVLVLGADVFVAGIGINLLADGVTVFLLERLYNNEGSYTPTTFPTLWRLTLPSSWANDPVLGYVYHALSGQTAIVFFALLLVVVSHIVLYRTKIGVHIRATGENPEAVEAAGLNPTWLKFLTVMISGVCAGLGGAQLAMATLDAFIREMTNGVGFIGLSAEIFGNATPFGSLIASAIFGLANAVADRVQVIPSLNISPDLVLTLPYVVTLVALTLAMIRRRRARIA